VYDRDEDVFVYFNNDGGGAAIIDAVAFAARAERAGLAVTRHAAPRDSAAVPTGPSALGRTRSADASAQTAA